MGEMKAARLRLEGKSYKGDALLESSELLFRGERRLVIPFDRVEVVTAEGGRLSIRFGGREAVFELDAPATKWADKIKNPKSVLQKLGVKRGQTVSVLRVEDPAFLSALKALGADVHQTRPAKDSDAIFYGVARRRDLSRLAALKRALVPNGALWVIRPRGVKEVTEADVMSAGKAAGLVDVKVVRFSITQTAEKFVIPIASR